MKVYVDDNNLELGKRSGDLAADLILDAIARNGSAHILLATGASQFETLNQLITRADIPWNKVTMFHLDEYVNLPETHPASFRKYLKERFLEKVAPLQAAYLINGENDPVAECARLEKLITQAPVDVGLIGIGENGHLAFNDPPANFDTERSYLVVTLDDGCKMQQVNEGWFDGISNVPDTAISISVRQILRAKHLICSVPDARKAQAIKDSLEKEISNRYPASILRTHADCHLFLDKASAFLLSSDKKNDLQER